jgi:hypothetical protein
VRPLLYSPSGDVVAIETSNEDRKDAILIEMFGLLQGIPTCLAKWQPHGGVKAATAAMSDAIVDLIGRPRLEQAWGITFQDAPTPKTFADVEAAVGG